MPKKKQKETVSRIVDGDTLKTAPRTKSVRLAGVYAPDKGEPGFKGSTNKLRQLTEGKKVKVYVKARDRYGRAVAEVKTEDGKSVNKEMNRFLKKKGW